MQRIATNVLWIGLAAVICLTLYAPPAAAGGRFGTTERVARPFDCYLPQLSGLPQFIQTPPATAIYRFSGNCSEGLRIASKVNGPRPRQETNQMRPRPLKSPVMSHFSRIANRAEKYPC